MYFTPVLFLCYTVYFKLLLKTSNVKTEMLLIAYLCLNVLELIKQV